MSAADITSAARRPIGRQRRGLTHTAGHGRARSGDGHHVFKPPLFLQRASGGRRQIDTAVGGGARRVLIGRGRRGWGGYGAPPFVMQPLSADDSRSARWTGARKLAAAATATAGRPEWLRESEGAWTRVGRSPRSVRPGRRAVREWRPTGWDLLASGTVRQ